MEEEKSLKAPLQKHKSTFKVTKPVLLIQHLKNKQKNPHKPSFSIVLQLTSVQTAAHMCHFTLDRELGFSDVTSLLPVLSVPFNISQSNSVSF